MKKILLSLFITSLLLSGQVFAKGQVCFVNNGNTIEAPVEQIFYLVKWQRASDGTTGNGQTPPLAVSHMGTTGNFPTDSIDTFDVLISPYSNFPSWKNCVTGVNYKEKKEEGDIIIYGWIQKDTGKFECSITYGQSNSNCVK